MVTLDTMECEDEVSETMALFWTNFNEALQKVSGVPNLMFNPIGWMADEAGANWAGLREVFGSYRITYFHQVALTNAELMDIFKCADQFPGSSQGSDIPYHTHYAGSSQPSKIPHSQPDHTHSARSSQPSLTQSTNSAGSSQQSRFLLPTHSTVPNSPITEEQIFQQHSYIAQIWKLTLLPYQPGQSHTCSGCRQVFKEQEVHVAVCGLYIPKNATFCLVYQGHFTSV